LDFSADNQLFIDEFANATVTVTLTGVAVQTFRAIFDESVEVISPYQSERANFKPQLAALTSNIAVIDSSMVFEVLKDGESETRRCSFDGKPRPDGSGLSMVFLAGKK
jgi:hypothetical protein